MKNLLTSDRVSTTNKFTLMHCFPSLITTEVFRWPVLNASPCIHSICSQCDYLYIDATKYSTMSINTLPMQNGSDKVTLLGLGLCPNLMLYNDFVVNDRRTRKETNEATHLLSCQNWQRVECSDVVFISCIVQNLSQLLSGIFFALFL